jgi:hypothetical protein
MMVMLLTMLLLSGGEQNTLLGHIAAAEERLAQVVVEPERRSEARRLLGRMRRHNIAVDAVAQQRFRRLSSELAKRVPDRVAINAIMDNHYATLRQFNEKMIALRFELREQLTREEWDALFGELI